VTVNLIGITMTVHLIGTPHAAASLRQEKCSPFERARWFGRPKVHLTSRKFDEALLVFMHSRHAHARGHESLTVNRLGLEHHETPR
jgi:hypothetical protein